MARDERGNPVQGSTHVLFFVLWFERRRGMRDWRRSHPSHAVAMTNATESDQATLNEDQAKVYDRQLRVWGLEVQNRLSAAKVLVAGGDGVAAEIAKNLVLAGVGLVAVADDTPCASAAFGNFLVPASSPPTSSVAEAVACTLQAMNPLIRVKAQAGCSCALGEEALEQFDTVVASGLSLRETQELEAKCTRLGKQLFSCMSRGPSSCTFVNLNSHTYSVKAKGGQKGEPQVVQYPLLEQALSTPLSKLDKKIHPLYHVMRVVFEFEKRFKRPPTAEDVEALEACAAELTLAEAGEKAGPHATPRPDLIQSWASFSAELAPVAAVVGGVVANHVIRAVSRVNAPIKNLFFFSLFDNMGVVEDMPLP